MFWTEKCCLNRSFSIDKCEHYSIMYAVLNRVKFDRMRGIHIYVRNCSLLLSYFIISSLQICIFTRVRRAHSNYCSVDTSKHESSQKRRKKENIQWWKESSKRSLSITISVSFISFILYVNRWKCAVAWNIVAIVPSNIAKQNRAHKNAAHKFE